MEHTHEEAVHSGEKVTLSLLQLYCWWIGMKDNVKFLDYEVLHLPEQNYRPESCTVAFRFTTPP